MSRDTRHVVVTGASRGLGRAIAEALAGPGTTISLVARDEVALEEVADRCRTAGSRCRWWAHDLTHADAVESVHDRTVEAFGPADVVFANAGAGHYARVEDTDEDALRHQLETNVVGTYLTCRAFGRSMIAGGGGKVVTTASDLGLRGEPGWSAYAASKAAVIAMSKSMAWEWAPAVTVNVLAPGAFATDLNAEMFARDGVEEHLREAIPLGRIGRPEEIAEVARLLAGPGSDYMTGSVLTVTGGIGRF